MSLSRLETLCLANHARYEIAFDGELYVKTVATAGTTCAIFLRENEDGSLAAMTDFSIKGKNIPNPTNLVQAIIELIESKDLQISFDDETEKFYLGCSLYPKTFIADMDFFADICEGFSASLDRIRETGGWNDQLLVLAFGILQTAH